MIHFDIYSNLCVIYVINSRYSSIAYVSQEPWLQNSKIRDNILFGELYRPKRYDLVLEACALKDDLKLMPSGDLTLIKGNGINISGGQKQRIAVARAIYSSSNVVILVSYKNFSFLCRSKTASSCCFY